MSAPARNWIDRPLPTADEPTVRAGAARYAALAGELRRLRLLVIGALNSKVGWSGTARLAFEAAVRAQAAELEPAATRYEGYAAALNGYARALEVIRPRLLSARAELVARAALPGAESTAFLAEFDRSWSEWDEARGRCVASLVVAGGVAADQRRHGWSSLLCGVSRLVPARVELTKLSRVLSDLGQTLLVAGAVLSLVCPPAAGAVWTALAVVAVCQFAVDAARRERGEPVGWLQLGGDALAAVPVGRLAAGVSSAAQASAAIDRLAPELRYSRLMPGGGLAAHEGTATYRGHTLLKHVGKSSEELARRFNAEPHLKWPSTFANRHVAEAAVARALEDGRGALVEWLGSSRQTLRVEADFGTGIGLSVASDGTMVTTSRLRIVLRKEETVLGYYIKSAFPAP